MKSLLRLRLVALMGLLVACSGGDLVSDYSPTTASVEPPRSSAEPATSNAELARSRVEGFGVVVDVPAGWSSLNNSEYGLQVARQGADLGTTGPVTGPRLTVTRSRTEPLDTDAMVAAVVAPTDSVDLVEEPQPISIAGNEGISVAVAEIIGGTEVIRRYVTVNVGGADAVQFVLEAPAGQWTEVLSELESMLQGAMFEPADVAVPATLTPTTQANTTIPAGGGTGSEDDPFRLPYLETFDPPVDSRWNRIIEQEGDTSGAFGVSTWDVADGLLRATGEGVQLTVPRTPWVPEFDFPDTELVAVDLEVTQDTTDTACGLLIGLGDQEQDSLIGLFVDSVGRRVLKWAPVNLADRVLPWTSDSSVRSGVTNELSLVVSPPDHPLGAKMIFSVNGEEVAEITDWANDGDELFSVVPGAVFEPSNSVGECRFDNFSVTE